ncbi:hypothetical protein BC829DRAFT_426299 [Chytridium lagenaria]|nr:hypothetical protein BC829DRAFT_426299 [Chytridium lagenaria]
MFLIHKCRGLNGSFRAVRRPTSTPSPTRTPFRRINPPLCPYLALSQLTAKSRHPRSRHSFLDFVNASPSPFHAVAEVRKRLESSGFVSISERDVFKLNRGGKYFFTRNQSSIVAFAVGGKYERGNGFSVVGAHTDSPCLKVKPGYAKVGVETYGGGLWNTCIAGRVLVRNGDGNISHHLVKIDRPILRIPTLAIHLDRAVNTEGFKYNTETHLTPMLASAAKIRRIGDFELCLYDTQPSTIGGLENEFIFSLALINSVGNNTLADDPTIRIVTLFDNEEVGSVSAYGAGSNLLPSTLKRLAEAEVVDALAGAGVADMAHAIHPNYSEKHEENHRPSMNKGVVIKQNANQRYATTAVTTSILRELARKKDVPLQEVRNDSPCGSTIGPMLSAELGIRTVDVGSPQLSMHSIRETCGVHDVQYAIDLFQSFFESFAAVDASIKVDE